MYLLEAVPVIGNLLETCLRYAILLTQGLPCEGTTGALLT